MRDQDNHEDGQIGEAWWASLARRVLHPTQVQIVEALQRSDEPLSAADLVEIVDTKHGPSQMVHHLRRLQHVKAIEVAERPTLQNATSIRFRLVLKGGDDEPQ